MNKTICIAAIVLSLMATGCKRQQTSEDVITITADFKQARPSFDLADILEDRVEIIPLQTTSESLVGNVSDVRIVGDRVIVVDKDSKKIVAFDRAGNYLNQIGRIGRGPQEYLDLTAAEVTDEHAVIFDKLTQKLHFYRHDGSFVRTQDVSNLWAMDIVEVGDRLYFVNNGSSSQEGYYRLFELTDEGEYIRPLLPFDEKDGAWSLDRYNSKNGAELLTYFTPRDSLYVFQDGKLKELFYVDFGSRKAPQSVIDIGYNALETIIRQKLISGVGRVHLTDKYIIIAFSEEEDYTAIYDRRTGKCEVSKRFIYHSRYPGLGYFFPKNIIRDNELIVQMNAIGIKTRVAYDKEYTDPASVKSDFQLRMIELAESLDDYDNPVLFVQKFK